MILGANFGGISFTAEACATTVPLFKVTVLFDRFLRANPTCLEPAFGKLYLILCILHFLAYQLAKV